MHDGTYGADEAADSREADDVAEHDRHAVEHLTNKAASHY